jgi:hypothetical protein
LQQGLLNAGLRPLLYVKTLQNNISLFTIPSI